MDYGSTIGSYLPMHALRLCLRAFRIFPSSSSPAYVFLQMNQLDSGRVKAFTKNVYNSISLRYRNDCLLKCLYTNATSVINKMDEFVANVSELQSDILFYTYTV